MSEDWTFVKNSNAGAQQATTPLKLKNSQVENLLAQHTQQEKKRGPTTPLTPTLIQKNIVKKQTLLKERVADEDSKKENEVQGSPKSRKSSILQQIQNEENHQLTPKMAQGIKTAVKDQKVSRLQLLRQSEQSNPGNTSIYSDADYSEVSSISGDTPNYKINSNLIYYKNGYYIDGDVDDSFYETRKENIVQAKELSRLNNVLEFMTLEKEFESNDDV